MLQLILIAVISLLAQLVLPWWSVAIVAFAVCFWRSTSAGRAFWHGFAGVALVWLLYALMIHVRTDGILTGRMGQLIFKADGAVFPLLVTALLGGLVGGLAAMSGYYVRLLFQNQIANRSA